MYSFLRIIRARFNTRAPSIERLKTRKKKEKKLGVREEIVRVSRKNLTGIQNVPEARTAGAAGAGAGSLADLIVDALRGARCYVRVRHPYAHLPEVLARRALPSLFAAELCASDGTECSLLRVSAPGERSRKQWRILPHTRARARVPNDAL